MYIKTKIVETVFERPSKLGKVHRYVRKKSLAVLICDNCDNTFERELKKISRSRLNNNYFHCCSQCDIKRFAQRKSVERKRIWDLPASVDLPVGKY
jgi:hypothetical protein